MGTRLQKDGSILRHREKESKKRARQIREATMLFWSQFEVCMHYLLEGFKMDLKYEQ